MSGSNLIARLREIVPARARERRSFDDAGFKGYSDRRPHGLIAKLVVQGAVDVFWRRSSESLVVVAGESQEACDAITTRFNGATLIVEGHGSGGVTVVANGNVTVAAGGDIWINGVRVNAGPAHGRAAVFVAGPTAPDVQIRGSGDVVLQGVEQQALDLQVVGSGDIEVDGRVERLTAEVAGSGDIDASDLIAQSVDCSVAGSGDVDVHAVRGIRARVAGSGDITVRGSPAIRDTNVAGSGDIRFKNSR